MRSAIFHQSFFVTILLFCHKQWSFYPRVSVFQVLYTLITTLQWCRLGPSLHRRMQSQMDLSHLILRQQNLIYFISEVINHSTIYCLPIIDLNILVCASTKFTRMSFLDFDRSLACLIDPIPISTKNLHGGMQIRYLKVPFKWLLINMFPTP